MPCVKTREHFTRRHFVGRCRRPSRSCSGGDGAHEVEDGVFNGPRGGSPRPQTCRDLASPSVCQHRAARQAAEDGLECWEQSTERQLQRAGQHDHWQHGGDRICERERSIRPDWSRGLTTHSAARRHFMSATEHQHARSVSRPVCHAAQNDRIYMWSGE